MTRLKPVKQFMVEVRQRNGRRLPSRKRQIAYIAAHEAGWKSAKHASQWRNTLAAHAYPVAGRLLVTSILGAAEDGFVFRSKKHLPPLFDPVGVNIELLSKVTKGLFSANSGEGNLRLERRCLIPAGTSCHVGSPIEGSLCPLRVENPPISGVQISRATSVIHSLQLNAVKECCLIIAPLINPPSRWPARRHRQ